MKYLYGLLLVASVILWSSCRNDFDSVPSTGNLEFSRDTVYLDTVFTNIGSSTYNLKVYNRTDEDMTIPTIRLGQGESSFYRLNVDGIPGKSFEDIQVLANDSIFIFVETTVDITNQTNNTQFLYTDQIVFDGGGNEQKVELVTLIQDAVFLFPADLGNGMFETLSEHIKIIEWPELIHPKPKNRVDILFKYSKLINSRDIQIFGFGKWKDYKFDEI